MKFSYKQILIFLVLISSFMACRRDNPKNKLPVKKQVVERAKQKLPRMAPSRLEKQFIDAGLVDVCKLDSSIRFDLRYAGTNNFTKTLLYDTLRSVFLQPEAARKLILAQKQLRIIDPSLRLLVWDAARPMIVQRKMYSRVAGTPFHSYVASPSRTGLHNYGCAVDLGICRVDGTLLDMGTPFDFFGKKAGIIHEEALVKQGILTREQVKNRRLLRRVMVNSGFLTVTGEWWHFNAYSLPRTKQKYKVLE